VTPRSCDDVLRSVSITAARCVALKRFNALHSALTIARHATTTPCKATRSRNGNTPLECVFVFTSTKSDTL